MTSYKVIDKYNNVYLCNEEYDESTKTHNIELGGSINTPCVGLTLSDGQFYLNEVTYNEKCSFNGLVRGSRGTKSMVLTALCIAKHLEPTVSTFIIQDNSDIITTTGDFSLHDYYIITRGYTWYQSFLDLASGDSLQILVNKLRQNINWNPTEIANKYGMVLTDVKTVLYKCETTCTWLEFNFTLFTVFPEKRFNSMFAQIIDAHTTKGFHKRLHIKPYIGIFSDIACDQVYTMERRSKYLPFNSQTGGKKKSKHVFYLGEESID